MPDLGDGLLGCFRCGYVWRLRKAPVRICPRCKSTSWNSARTVTRAPTARKGGLGVEDILGPKRNALRSLAREYGVVSLSVFGSVARGEARADSDIDLLVVFRQPIGLLRRGELKERAGALLGRPVDLATEANLHWMVRPRVMGEAIPL